MIRCPSCLTEAPETARFCPSCGEAISSISQMPTGLATPSVAEAARRRSPSSAPVGRLVSSDVIEAGGFTPGTVLAERYRIIGLLGHGGMGEVYRADDLKLGQPVALKFLPRGLAEDPARLERFYAEVRIARQVSHPNVCRVYDVGEIEGQNYLSMEFVDGEDLASLLKRIGLLDISAENIVVEVPMVLALAILTISVVTRFGIVALAVSLLLRGLFLGFPLTLDFSRWYSGRSLFLLLILAGLAFYGFRTSLGGKPDFGAAALDEA